MSPDDVFRQEPKITLEEAKRKVCSLFYSASHVLTQTEEDDCFFPQLAKWAKMNMPTSSALDVIEQKFVSFDPIAQKRVAKILETYLNQLGSF